jgi:hypothetical protein
MTHLTGIDLVAHFFWLLFMAKASIIDAHQALLYIILTLLPFFLAWFGTPFLRPPLPNFSNSRFGIISASLFGIFP